MSTQWRAGGAGVIGLDYAALPTVLRMLRIKRADEPEIFADLREMERAAKQKINQRQ